MEEFSSAFLGGVVGVCVGTSGTGLSHLALEEADK